MLQYQVVVIGPMKNSEEEQGDRKTGLLYLTESYSEGALL